MEMGDVITTTMTKDQKTRSPKSETPLVASATEQLHELIASLQRKQQSPNATKTAEVIVRFCGVV